MVGFILSLLCFMMPNVKAILVLIVAANHPRFSREPFPKKNVIAGSSNVIIAYSL